MHSHGHGRLRQGEEVAGRLFQHALERGAVLPEPGHVPPSSQPQAGAAGPSAGSQNPAGGAQDPTGAARYPGAASMGIDIDAFAASFGLLPGTFPLPAQPRQALFPLPKDHRMEAVCQPVHCQKVYALLVQTASVIRLCLPLLLIKR